jgi:hypothetical protein
LFYFLLSKPMYRSEKTKVWDSKSIGYDELGGLRYIPLYQNQNCNLALNIWDWDLLSKWNMRSNNKGKE